MSDNLENRVAGLESNMETVQATLQQIAQLQLVNTRSIADLQASIADVIQMMTTQAEEAAADRAEMRHMIERMFSNPRNGNGSSEGNP